MCWGADEQGWVACPDDLLRTEVGCAGAAASSQARVGRICATASGCSCVWSAPGTGRSPPRAAGVDTWGRCPPPLPHHPTCSPSPPTWAWSPPPPSCLWCRCGSAAPWTVSPAACPRSPRCARAGWGQRQEALGAAGAAAPAYIALLPGERCAAVRGTPVLAVLASCPARSHQPLFSTRGPLHAPLPDRARSWMTVCPATAPGPAWHPAASGRSARSPSRPPALMATCWWRRCGCLVGAGPAQLSLPRSLC